MITIDQENFYWLFSSSAQTISAFVAFLITGYALVLNVMQNLEQKDETFEEIHHKIKEKHYRGLVVLAVITGLAIISSLAMVYINGTDCAWKLWLYLGTSFVNVLAIIVGIIFVLSIINPNRYRNAAKEIIEEDKLENPKTSNDVDTTLFMTEFIKLEKKVRDILQTRQLYVPYGNSPRMVYSFRQMIEALNQNELTSYYTYLDLMKINKYRNLVFHGHLDKVDSEMLEKLKEASKKIDTINSKT